MGKGEQFEYDYFDEKMEQLFYHGTSDVFPISFIRPAIETGCLREDWRKSLIDKVFMTNSVCSAEKYAEKATIKFGGKPIGYVVRPIGDVWQVNLTEFVSDAAEIISVVSREES